MMSTSLLDDISDTLLVCRICLDSLRRPRTLACRHTFCQVCLERLRDSEIVTTADDDDVRVSSSRRRSHGSAAQLTCPVCYERCALPAGGVSRLPGDPVVTRLYNIIERCKSSVTSSDGDDGSEKMCEICSNWSSVRPGTGRHRIGHVMCVECVRLMCSPCARLHRRTNVTSGHSLIDRDNNSDLSIHCQHHSNELVQFYCDTCDVCVCVLCTYVGQAHSGDSHNVLSFSDALTAQQAPFRALLADCTQRLNHVQTRYNAVLSHDQLIRKVEASIHEVATETVSHVRKQERQLVSALYSLCGDINVDAQNTDGKKVLSEQVRRLDDACSAAEKLLISVSDGGGPAAFLLQRQSTVDAMMTSLMTSQTNSVSDWPMNERQVRFEAYGLESVHGLRVGRLVVDKQDSDVEDGSQLDVVGGSSDWVEVTLSDVSVQTDDCSQLQSPSSRCQASGSVSSALRLGACHDQQHDVSTGASASTRRRPASPPLPLSSSSAAAAGVSVTRSEQSDASTSTAVHITSSSTMTHRLETCDQSTYADLSAGTAIIVCHEKQTSTESLTDVCHRATSTDTPHTCSLAVTAAPDTADESTQTETHLPHRPEDTGDHTDKDSTQPNSLSMCSAPIIANSTMLQSPYSSTLVGDSFVFVESPLTLHQTPTVNVSSLSSSAGRGVGLTHLTSSMKTDTDEDSAASSTTSVQRFAALLPEIARTADVLAASHVSTGLTARLLAEIIDVGLQLTSSCKCETQDAATDTTDHETLSVHETTSHTARRSDVKWTQTTDVRGDVVDEGVGLSVVTTSDAATLAKLTPMTFDKETSTIRAQQMNKNISTDSLSTADKQTWMPTDVASAYLASTACSSRRVTSVSRGTSTVASSYHLVDRATSPVTVTLVDKCVMASKADALEPLDTFKTAGQLSGPLSPRTRRPLSLSPRSKLACISETVERCDEDLDDGDDSVVDTLDASQTQRTGILTSTHLLVTSQQPSAAGQFSENVFNFDDVVTPCLLTEAPTDTESTGYEHATSL